MITECEWIVLRLTPQRTVSSRPGNRPDSDCADLPPCYGVLAWYATTNSCTSDDQTGGRALVESRTPDCAVFDADRLSAPLIIRAWQAGDRIHPRGMRGKRKKLQDIFTDMKVSRDERSRIPLIVAPEGILWVVGRRQDERCAVGKDTRRCLVVTVQSKAGSGPDKMERIFGRPIVTQEEMRARIKELGKQIANDYAGKDLVLVGVLKGAYAFYADLARAIRIPMRVDFLIVASYGNQSKTSGKVKVITELTEQIKGKDVLLVEDIVDSGLTVEY